MTAEINPNMAISMARQFGITVFHNEAEHLVSLFKMWHRTGFENGQAIERDACAMAADQISNKYAFGYYGQEVDTADEIAAAIRARGTE